MNASINDPPLYWYLTTALAISKASTTEIMVTTAAVVTELERAFHKLLSARSWEYHLKEKPVNLPKDFAELKENPIMTTIGKYMKIRMRIVYDFRILSKIFTSENYLLDSCVFQVYYNYG